MKEFFDTLFGMGKAQRKDLLEKDYYLHLLMTRFAADKYLAENLLFKGGTCLIKAHMGYYRFSEDLDFTWADQSLWRGMSATRIRALCSKLIDTTTATLSAIIQELGLEFEPHKNNPEYVDVSSGGRMVRFYVYYEGELGRTRLKLEINFYELLLNPPEQKSLSRYVEGLKSSELEILRFRFPDQMAVYEQEVSFNCYPVEEIFIEKCRAALTRRTFKLRDYIDLSLLEHHCGLSIPGLAAKISNKVNFLLQLYHRYRDNLGLFATLPENILPEEENRLLLAPLPDSLDLQETVVRIHAELNRIAERL